MPTTPYASTVDRLFAIVAAELYLEDEFEVNARIRSAVEPWLTELAAKADRVGVTQARLLQVTDLRDIDQLEAKLAAATERHKSFPPTAASKPTRRQRRSRRCARRSRLVGRQPSGGAAPARTYRPRSSWSR